MPWTPVRTWVTGDVLPASDLNTYLRDNLAFLHDQGADLASAATITPTTQFHRVTGSTTITNVTILPAGTRLLLWPQAAVVFQHGTGNLKLLANSDAAIPASGTITLLSDGTYWYELDRSPKTAPLLTATQFNAISLPIDGFLVYYVADTSGAIWPLRYNANSTSPYKWEAVGQGVGIHAVDGTTRTTTSSTPTDPGVIALVLPRAGDYEIEFGGLLTNPQGWVSSAITVFGGVTSLVGVSHTSSANASQTEAVHVWRKTSIAAQPAGTTLTLRISNGDGASSIGATREIYATPKRVS